MASPCRIRTKFLEGPGALGPGYDPLGNDGSIFTCSGTTTSCSCGECTGGRWFQIEVRTKPTLWLLRGFGVVRYGCMRRSWVDSCYGQGNIPRQ